MRKKIKDLMSKNLITLTKNQTIKDAATLLRDTGFYSIPVINEFNEFIGFFSKTCLSDAIIKNISFDVPITEIMRKDVITLNPDDRPELVWNLPENRMPVLDDKKKLLGIVTKVDLLKYFFEEYKTVNETLQTILNSTYNGIIAIDKEGSVSLVNKAARRILNLGNEAVGKRIEQVIPNTGLLITLRTGTIEPGQLLKIGDVTIFTNRTPIIKDGEIIGAVATFQDITEVTKLSTELAAAKHSVETLETILNSTYDGIVVVDHNGIITKFNKAYQEFLGIPEKDAVGKHVTDVIQNTRMHIVIKTGQAEIGDTQKIQGKEMIVMRIPIFKEGEIVGAVGKVMFRDIKEVKALAQRLNLIKSELNYYKGELRRIQGAKYNFNNIIGESYKIMRVKKLAKKASSSNSTVLIRGESGTGKELFAHAIHEASYRKYGPFIRMNCAAIPGNLLEAELFGYEEGAFTGAQKGGKPGKFELADGGTIFLDEIGDMPLEMQVKLLRVLQEKEVERIGGTKLINLDVRVIVATNKDIEKMVERGEFRKDLYYRLNVIKVEIPPLREMVEDIPLIVKHIISELNDELGTKIEGADDEVFEIFSNYHWPGNVRELKNVVERSINVCDSRIIRKKHLPLYIIENNSIGHITKDVELILHQKDIKDLGELMDIVEKQAIIKALNEAEGNKKKAAEILGIHRSGLYQKLSKHGIEM